MEQDFQQELFEIFKQEAEDYLGVLNDGLHRLKDGADEQVVEQIFRTTHSLKGAARAVSFSAVEELCQALESIFSKLKDKEMELSADLIDLFAEAFDELEALVIASDLEAQPDIELLGSLQSVLAGNLKLKKQPAKAKPRRQPVRKSEESKSSKTEKPAASAETIRISYERLQNLLQKSEELISVKIKYRYYLRKLEAMQSLVAQLLPEHGYSSMLSHSDEQLEILTSLKQQLENYQKLLANDSFQVSALIEGHLGDIRNLMLFPFSTITGYLERSTRNIAKELNKKIDLKIMGAETEIDKHILELLKDPLIHLIRNSIDHGIEDPQERIYRGKPMVGTIKVEVFPASDQKIKIKISDDGQGFDLNRIKAKVIENGLATEDELNQMSEGEALSFIFHSGFSTKTEVSKLSGRGLGMAVVKENIEKLGGSLQVKNDYPNGCSFLLSIPLSFASGHGILFQLANHKMIIPTQVVEQIVRIPFNQLKSAKNQLMINVKGELIPVHQLREILNIKGDTEAVSKGNLSLLILNHHSRKLALIVDEILEEREILLKKLSPPLNDVTLLAGLTLLGDGSLVPVLNPAEIFELSKQGGKARIKTGHDKPKKILVAEDSITSRMLLKNVLQTAGYHVELAVNGKLAWEKLNEQNYDLLISDIQMPQMDGIELTKKVKSDRKLKKLPVVLLTSLGSEEDREKGLKAGANAYFVKGDFKQSSILELIKTLV